MLRITFQDVFDTPTTASVQLGAVASTPDQRSWVYARADEAIGLSHVAVPLSLNDVDTVSSSADNDGNIIYITEASAGWPLNGFAGAWGHVNAGTGAGQVFRVKSNTSDTLTLFPEYALETALSVSDSDIQLEISNLLEKSAITDKLQNASGVAQVDFAANDYGWFLNSGRGTVLAGEVLTESASCMTGDDTEGQVLKGITAEGNFDYQTIGICISANSGADVEALVNVTLAA